MPVKLKYDNKGAYAQYGTHGAKYYYDAGNKESRNRAKQKAYNQEFAIHKSKERENKQK